MAEKNVRHIPGVYWVYGVPLMMSLENHKDGLKAVFQLGKDSALVPEKERKRYKRKLMVPKNLVGHPKEAIVNALAPEYFFRAFKLDHLPESSPEREAKIHIRARLPLAAVWAADRRAAAAFYDWKPGTLADHSYYMKLLIRSFGAVPLEELTPQQYGSQIQSGKWDALRVLASLRKLMDYEAALGALRENLWADYMPQTPRRADRNNPQKQKRKNLDPRMLTNADVDQIVEDCCAGAAGDPMFFAALLWILLPMDLEEICALRVKDLIPVNGQDGRYVIQIRQRLVKSSTKKNWLLKTYYQPEQKRRIPLPDLVCDAYQDLIRSDCGAKQYRTKEQFLFFRNNNRNRFVSPEMIANWVYGKWKSVFIPICEKKDLPRILKNTVIVNLGKNGAELDELRYLQGLPRLDTDGKHYCGFRSEIMQANLRNTMERWVMNLVSGPGEIRSEADAIPLTRQGQQLWITAAKGTQIRAELNVDVLPCGEGKSSALDLQVMAPRGFRGISIQWQKRKVG